MSNSITNLTNTRWQLNETLTGTANRPSCTTWTPGTKYIINGNLDGYQLSGLAFVKNTSVAAFPNNPNLADVVVPQGALLLSSNSMQDNYVGIDTFLTNCSYIGLSDFDFGEFGRAFYISLQVTGTGGSTLLAPAWATTVNNRILTIFGGSDVTNSELIEWLEDNATFLGWSQPSVPSLFLTDILIGEPYSSTKPGISFSTGFNKIKTSIQSNISLNYIEARITYEDAPTDIGEGILGYQNAGSIAGNTFFDMIIPVTSSTFKYGSGRYTISIYAKAQDTGTWSETRFFIDVNNCDFKTSSGEQLEVISIYSEDTEEDLLPIGGRVFYVNPDGGSGATYTFYDENYNEITDQTVSGLANAVYYSKTGTSASDKFYVYDTTNGLSTNEWGYYGTETGATSNTIGSGKTNTAMIFAKGIQEWGDDDPSLPTVWKYISDMRTNKVGGCDDWFVASEAEQALLKSSGLVTWYSNNNIWSSVESSSTNVWCWRCSSSGWYSYGKYGTYCVFGCRAF